MAFEYYKDTYDREEMGNQIKLITETQEKKMLDRNSALKSP